MKPERDAAVRAMQSMGWTSSRKKTGSRPMWEFRRPAADGLSDLVRCGQASLSMQWVADVAIKNGDAPELAREIEAAKARWVGARFRGVFCLDPRAQNYWSSTGG